jgi:hypothetical protein
LFLGGKNADELLCKRVLTTSSGHVTIAPTVPATLENKKKEKHQTLVTRMKMLADQKKMAPVEFINFSVIFITFTKRVL